MKRNFYQEIHDRFKKPWNTAFIGYFILIIILIAGFGVIFPLFKSFELEKDIWILTAQNLSTYFMAILATSVIDLNLSWNLDNRVSFLVYSLIVLLIGISFVVWTYSLNTSCAFVPAVLGCLMAWFLWILANADNEKLNDDNFYKKMRGIDRHGTGWER